MLNYSEYLEIGGNIKEEDFPLFLEHAINKIDFVTMGRFSKFTPDKETKRKIDLLLVRVISLIEEQADFKMRGVSAYSNGIESITYSDSYTEKEVNKRVKELCTEYLQGTGLLYRGVR